MRYKLQLILLCVLNMLFYSCSKQLQKEKLKQTVVGHYSNPSDSLKKKAALFLMKNIEKKFQHTGSNYDDFIRFFDKYCHIRDTFVVRCDAFRSASYKKDEDIKNISASYIIDNIDKAFATLDSTKFKNQVDFTTFCEYVLPYRIKNEVLEYWRDSALVDVPDSIFKNDDLAIACEELTRTMVENKKDFLLRFGKNALNLPDLPYTKQKKLLAGSCDDVAPYSMFLARAAGMPVAQDFTPNYANRSSGHTWCALVLDKNNSIPFNVPNSETMGEYTLSDFIVSKVYRHTYSDNAESHFFQRGNSRFVPDFMNNPNLIDVTDQYHKTSKIKVPVNNISKKVDFGYLCVFDNKNWQIVDWGGITNERASFKKVPQGVMFLPVIKESSRQEPINDPFVINQNNKIQYIKPNYSEKITVTVKRKYWVSNRINTYMERMIGGKFEASNHPDFRDAVTLFEVTENPGGIYNEKRISITGKFQYYRYYSPKDGYGNIAELEFYQQKEEKPVKGKIIGTEGSWEDNPKSTRKAAFDGKALTYFDSPWPNNSWVGMDFGQPVKINKIRYLARNDDNNILTGGDYELFYWDNEWKSHTRKTATSDSLIFENVPSDALYLLHYYGPGTEERIFTYENEKQIWW